MWGTILTVVMIVLGAISLAIGLKFDLDNYHDAKAGTLVVYESRWPWRWLILGAIFAAVIIGLQILCGCEWDWPAWSVAAFAFCAAYGPIRFVWPRQIASC